MILIKKLLPTIVLLTGCGGSMSFSPRHTVTIPWTAQGAPTTFSIYRKIGVCPDNLDTSLGWSDIAKTSPQSVNYVDTVQAGVYSYDVEANDPLNPENYSGPSNCVTVQIR